MKKLLITEQQYNKLIGLSEEIYTAYHVTNNLFDKFDFKRSPGNIVWFTDSIDEIKNRTTGASGSKYIMKRNLVFNNPAGWDEYEKYGIGQLRSMGYDGLILPDEGRNTFIAFSPKNIKKIKGFNLVESSDKILLGYHSSKRDMPDGYYKGSVLNPIEYEDIIRNAYIEIINDWDENIENENIEGMNDVFNELGYGFTYVSRQPIEASAFQPEKYKYGNNLYKVYGNGNEILLDDINEINADIVVSNNPLYFEKQ